MYAASSRICTHSEEQERRIVKSVRAPSAPCPSPISSSSIPCPPFKHPSAPLPLRCPPAIEWHVHSQHLRRTTNTHKHTHLESTYDEFTFSKTGQKQQKQQQQLQEGHQEQDSTRPPTSIAYSGNWSREADGPRNGARGCSMEDVGWRDACRLSHIQNSSGSSWPKGAEGGRSGAGGVAQTPDEAQEAKCVRLSCNFQVQNPKSNHYPLVTTQETIRNA